MRFSIVTRYIGFILFVNAGFMLLSMVISIFNHMDTAFYPLLLSAIITGMVGLFPMIFVPSAHSSISVKEMYAIVVLSWVFCCLFGTLPYVLWGGEFSVTNAWYESVSGFTTTGSTILNDIEALPKGLLFWRSSTNWIGGVGVVLFSLLILPSMRNTKMRLSQIEMSPMAKENFKFKTQEIVRILLIVYLVITLLTAVSLWFAGMNVFDAVNHAFSIVATGGFSTKNASIQYFNSNVIYGVVLFFMVLSGIHFGVIYSFFTRKSTFLLRSSIIRYYLIGLIVGALFIALNLFINGNYNNFGQSYLESLFQLSSVTTTTGFATTDTSVWPSFSILIMLFFMFQGACAGSTSGAIKADRFFILFKAIKAQIIKHEHPNAVVPVRVGNNSLEDSVVHSVILYIVFFILIVFGGTVLFSLMDLDLLSSFSSSLSATSNVGPAFGNFGSMANYSTMPELGKYLMTVLMLLGRLEIYGLLILFFSSNWK